mgnify:CR=1 FL=1
MSMEYHSSCLPCLMRQYLERKEDFEVVCANGHRFQRADMVRMMEVLDDTINRR